jgi:hypothetical protein
MWDMKDKVPRYKLRVGGGSDAFESRRIRKLKSTFPTFSYLRIDEWLGSLFTTLLLAVSKTATPGSCSHPPWNQAPRHGNDYTTLSLRYRIPNVPISPPATYKCT